MSFTRWFKISIALVFLLSVNSNEVAAFPTVTWPTITLTTVVSGLSRPVHIANAGDNSGRLFIVEQGGLVRIVRNGNLLVTPFLDIQGRVLSPSGGEQGLLSIAFPPGFGSGKNYFYVYYTNLDGNNQVSRFHLSSNPDVADASSEELILLIPHPTYSNHNGGQLVFGPDGYLYIGTGDGGSGGDPNKNAQNPASLLGKLLRIKVEEKPTPSVALPNKMYFPAVMASNTRPYSIPPSNPFVGQPGYRPEIWALGLRNPWRYSFDRLTGDLYIGDVGQDTREEVDLQLANSPGGQNYGWNIMEGFICYPPGTSCNSTGLTLPIHDYPHNPECSITGGFVYRGPTYPSMQGIYFYTDYCSGKIWGLQKINGTWQNQQLYVVGFGPTSFGEDQAGELYLATMSGTIYQIVTP